MNRWIFTSFGTLILGIFALLFWKIGWGIEWSNNMFNAFSPRSASKKQKSYLLVAGIELIVIGGSLIFIFDRWGLFK